MKYLRAQAMVTHQTRGRKQNAAFSTSLNTVAHFPFIPQLEALESQADCVPGTVQTLCTLACPVHPHNGGNISPAVNGTFFFLLVWIQSCSHICLISNHVLN